MRVRAKVSTGLAIASCAFVLSLSLPAASAVNSTPDPTYQTNGRVRTITALGDTVYIGGDFTSVRPAGDPPGTHEVPRNHVAAFSRSSGVLSLWNPNTNGTVWSIAVAPGGAAVYIGGAFTTVGGQPRLRLAEVDPGTGVATSWAPSVGAQVSAVVASSDGSRVYIGGLFTKVDGITVYRVAAVGTTSGGVFTTWRPRVMQISGAKCPPRCPPRVNSLALAADGQGIYIGGHFGLVDGVSRNNAAEVNLASNSVTTWDPNVFNPLGQQGTQNPNQVNQVYHIEPVPSGSSLGNAVFLCGDWWAIGPGPTGSKTHVVHPNLAEVGIGIGNVNRTFTAGTDGNTPMCTLLGNLLYVGGHFLKLGTTRPKVRGVARNRLGAVDAVTGTVDPWNPGANSILGIHAGAAEAPYLWIGGDFTRTGATDQQGFAQYSGS